MEKTGKRKEKLFFCFRVLIWVAALIILFAIAANLRVFTAEFEESEKDEPGDHSTYWNTSWMEAQIVSPENPFLIIN